MASNIIGIEVKGAIYAVKDEETAKVAENAKRDIQTQAKDISDLSKSVTDQQKEVAEMAKNIGDNDISEIASSVEANTEDIATLKEDVEKNTLDLTSILFGKLKLLQKREDGNYLGYGASTETYNFNIQDWNKMLGVVLVFSWRRGSYNGNPQTQDSIREARTFLKMPNGTLRTYLEGCVHGQRQVCNTHELTVDSLGRASLYAGYEPKEDGDSESDSSQDIIPVYEIYGILS